jgi:putative tryptophan/tyrosine transport system substrate-binding protein
MIGRREFITLIGSAAAAWPLAARAQQKKIDRVGVLLLDNADAALSALFLGALGDELRKAGYVEQQNVLFDIVSADGKIDQLPKLAAALVALKVDLIVALLTPSAYAAQQATREIPIVAYAGDLVGTGLVASLARPGGNITGVSAMTSELHGKCVELFKDMLPSTRRIGALINAADTSSKPILDQIENAGKMTGIEIAPTVFVRSPGEIDAAFTIMKKEKADAVVLQGSIPAKIAAELALAHRLPAATAFRPFAEAGGLMSYSVSFAEAAGMTAISAVKILHGAKPADLPVEQPTKFDLVINMKTANALGLTVPPTLIARADEVID